MLIAGYLASLVIGISLGLIGGGGSILTVPVLVYLFNVEPVMATAYSLFIVGTTSLAGVLPKYKSGEVNLKTAVIFGIPSIAAVFFTRKVIVPAIPKEIMRLDDLIITKAMLLMVLFAVLMVFASVSMIKKKKGNGGKTVATEQVFNYPLIFIEGIVVGILTGLVGAGGGFLIIPALVLLSKLPMKQAVGTSLLIIAAKSLIGFTGDLGSRIIDWKLMLSVTALAIIGIIAGNALSKKVDGEKLKTGFGWFVLVMGIYILVKEIFFPGGAAGH
ncbi:MAG: sulfite exporter TauE/SafE family protein [Bacteroidetes bacterium]|nr:sulfite exporter TauE/SafE family protein [Bacteroidota bacterium]